MMHLALGEDNESQLEADVTKSHLPGSRFQPPAVEDLAPHFPQLEIEQLLGCGGMGAVYKARQTSLDRLVALKVLPPDPDRDPAFAERFTREARALAKLSHPNVVMVFEFGEAGQYYYLVMEYVDGVDLRRTIHAGTLQPREALTIVPQICEALQYAHDNGVVHRDIKPENILLGKDGRVKIADFGLAKLLVPTNDQMALTGTQQVMGTPHYMAPEQLEKPAEVDHRADIYSLGVVFYELLTGELPLGQFAPPSQKANVGAGLDSVVMRSLAKEPDRRYQHASDVKSAVEACSPYEQARQGPSGHGSIPARKDRPLTLPFAIRSFYQGFETWQNAFGIMSYDGLAVTLEFEIRYAFTGALRSGPHTVSVPVDEIASLRLRQWWFNLPILVLQTDTMQSVSEIPKSRQGKVVFRIALSDFQTAKRFVDTVNRDLFGEPPAHAESATGAAYSKDTAATSETPSAREVEGDLALARHQVRGPVKGLQVVGWMNCILGMIAVLVGIGALVTWFWPPGVTGTPNAEYRIDSEALWIPLLGISGFTTWAAMHVAFGVGALVASARARELKGFGLTWGVVALSALPIHVGWIVGLPVVIWAWAVLQHSAVRQAFRVQARRDQEEIRHAAADLAQATAHPPKPTDPTELRAGAGRKLRGPAINLLIFSSINLATAVLFVVSILGTYRTPASNMLLLLAAGMMVLCGIAILFGAIQMLRLRWYSSAMLGGIVALLPCGPAWPLTLIFGILALVTLNRNEVRQAFALS